MLPGSGELSALLCPTELHPLFRSHLLTSFFFPGSRLDKGGTLSCGWDIQKNYIVFFSLLRLFLILCFKGVLVAVLDKRNIKWNCSSASLGHKFVEMNVLILLE